MRVVIIAVLCALMVTGCVTTGTTRANQLEPVTAVRG